MFLCYNTPASMNYFGWENEALPLGNGKIGAKVFGGTQCELIQFNEKTLWSGGKAVDGYNGGISNADHGEQMKKIQKLLDKGDRKGASAQMKGLEGNDIGYGAYQAFGNLYINFGSNDAVENYVRDLDLDSASCMVTYKKEKVTYTRHYFVSYPDNVFVGRIEADGEGSAFSFDAYVISEQLGKPYSQDDTIYLEGTVNANDGIDAKPGKDKNNMKYGCTVKFIAKDGTVTATEDGHISVENATSVMILMSLATDYKNSYPDYCDNSNPLEKATEAVLAAAEKSFGELYRTHLDDYRKLYNRVTFNLGEEESGQPTDFMLKRFAKRNEYKRNLITLLFQYGRYLLISSSRDGSLPANLQGIWNAKNNPPWQCDYHFNVNVQMNYWPAYVANLAETAVPYIDFVNSLKKPGRIVANQTMGIGENKADGSPDESKPTGWVVHTMVNPLGFVAPGWEWRWGWAPVNGAWAVQNMFDYYQFTKDIEKLKTDIYPTMEEAALLWSQLLTENKKTGRLEVSPCFSPEHGPVSKGGTYEQSIVYGLFDSVIHAADDLEKSGNGDAVNHSLVEKLKGQIEKLEPNAIGKWGQIKEWVDEDTFSHRGFGKLGGMGVQKHHRHISHLLGLYPYNQITKENHILMKGARISLDDRGIKTTGWALAYRLLAYARLGSAQKCDDVIEQLLKKMILKNLFGNHPPFQIDANFGFTAGVAEMLVQSHCNYISVLPALPAEWHMGEITGLMARGNFEVSLKWKDCKLKEGKIKSNLGGKCSLSYDGKVMLVQDAEGNEIDVDYIDGITTFETVPGGIYTFS
ncbi:MAG: glycoside hydrolase family 95 protein [Ruminococcus sp.]|nr:glycoside hydrolase family 95 protein [Ruminococcus sp.]